MVQCKRKTFCARSKTFKVPLVPLIPLVGMTTTLHIVMGVGWAACSVYAVWILLGLVIYFSYGICLSRQARAYRRKRDADSGDEDTGGEDTEPLINDKEDD